MPNPLLPTYWSVKTDQTQRTFGIPTGRSRRFGSRNKQAVEPPDLRRTAFFPFVARKGKKRGCIQKKHRYVNGKPYRCHSLVVQGFKGSSARGERRADSPPGPDR